MSSEHETVSLFPAGDESVSLSPAGERVAERGRPLGRALVIVAFLAGCATTAALQVPRANADAVNLQRWEHWCQDIDGVPTNDRLMKAGDEGWELVSLTFRPPVVQAGNSVGGGATYMCFKRPK